MVYTASRVEAQIQDGGSNPDGCLEETVTSPASGLIVAVESLSRVFVTPGTVARHAPLSIVFSRQEYWRGFPFPTLGVLRHPGIELTSFASSAMATQ